MSYPVGVFRLVDYLSFLFPYLSIQSLNLSVQLLHLRIIRSVNWLQTRQFRAGRLALRTQVCEQALRAVHARCSRAVLNSVGRQRLQNMVARLEENSLFRRVRRPFFEIGDFLHNHAVGRIERGDAQFFLKVHHPILRVLHRGSQIVDLSRQPIGNLLRVAVMRDEVVFDKLALQSVHDVGR